MTVPNCDPNCGPVLSKETAKQYAEKNRSYKEGKISTFATENEENPETYIYCYEKKKLEYCKRFMKNTFKERINFLPKQKSYYGC